MKTDRNLTALLPKNGSDTAGAAQLVAMGYPAVAPVLPHLFQWLESGGPLVDTIIAPFFATLGSPARDLVCKALEAPTKPALKNRLVRFVLPAWPREVLLTLPLEPMLQQYDFYGLDVWTLKLMIDKDIPSHTALDQWRQLKIASLDERLQALTG